MAQLEPSEAVCSGTGRKFPSRNPPVHPGVASSSILDSTVCQNQVTLPSSFHTVVHEHVRAAETKHLRKGCSSWVRAQET